MATRTPALDGWLGVAAVRDAQERTRDLVRRTPVLTSRSLSDECGGTVLLKAENLQRTGSFKLRGALAKVDRIAGAPARGVVAGSAGNHAQSLAYAARARGLACEVFMPAEASLAKVAAVRGFGGTVRLGGDSVDDCVARARERAGETGAVFVHPFDDPEIVAGQGTLGLELLDDVEDLATVVVPVGGGGLISGVAGVAQGGAARRADRSACRSRVVLRLPGVARARRAGRGARRPDDRRRHRDQAPRRARCCRSCARGSTRSSSSRRTTSPRRWSCCSSARSWSSRARERSASRRCSPARSCRRRRGATVVVLSGGNVDAGVLATVALRHETAEGRRLRFFTRVEDRPGGLARAAHADRGAPAATSSRSRTCARRCRCTSARPASTCCSRRAAPTTRRRSSRRSSRPATRSSAADR